jgi:hypothetical protein
MTGLCLKCGAQLSSPWRFCPLCGAEVSAVELTPQIRQQPPAAPEKAPIRGAFGGLFLGVIVTPICIIVGTMLCLTGLGAILGIPMIVGGIAAPLLGPMINLGEPKGECPWCGAEISNVFNASVQHQRFIKAA